MNKFNFTTKEKNQVLINLDSAFLVVVCPDKLVISFNKEIKNGLHEYKYIHYDIQENKPVVDNILSFVKEKWIKSIKQNTELECFINPIKIKTVEKVENGIEVYLDYTSDKKNSIIVKEIVL